MTRGRQVQIFVLSFLILTACGVTGALCYYDAYVEKQAAKSGIESMRFEIRSSNGTKMTITLP